MKYPKFDDNWERTRIDTMQMYIEIRDGHFSLSDLLEWRQRVWCEQYEVRETIRRLREEVDHLRAEGIAVRT